MNIDYSVMILVVIVEGILLGYIWSRAMVRRVIARTACSRKVIIGAAALGSLAMVLTIMFVMLVTTLLLGELAGAIFSVLTLLPGMILAVLTAFDLFSDGSLLFDIYRVFVSIIVIVPYTVVIIALPLYLGAAIGVKIATTRPLSWLAFLAPMATALVFLLAIIDKDSFGPIIFTILYTGMVDVIFAIFGHYGAIAFQVIFLTSVIPVLLWLGATLGAKVATIRPWLFVMFWATIAGAFVFFLNRDLDPSVALLSIGVAIYSGFSR